MDYKNEMAVVYGKRSKTLSKVERYSWTVKDEPGTYLNIDKNSLNVNKKYQRELIKKDLIKAIASKWSWLACAAIIVAKREGFYWVIDGQHRVLAASLRADIGLLPCIVFETEDIKQEAIAFRDINTGRGPVCSLDKFRANIEAGDELTIYVKQVLDEHGIILHPHTTKLPLHMKSISTIMRIAKEDRSAFETVIRTIARLCSQSSIPEIIILGLFYLHKHCSKNLNNVYMRNRIDTIGPDRLVVAARKSAAYYSKGGMKVYAEGMLMELNKGIREKMGLSTERS